MSEPIQDFKERSQKAITKLEENLAGIRTGRANISLLDRVQVEAYGTQMHIRDLATLSVSGARQISIEPFDRSQTNIIEKAIMTSDLNLTPMNDGKTIRLNLPPLTEERRKELVKLAKKEGEETKIAIRNIRRDSNEGLKKKAKDGEISEDQVKRGEKEIQTLTDQSVAKVDELLSKKEKEIIEI